MNLHKNIPISLGFFNYEYLLYIFYPLISKKLNFIFKNASLIFLLLLFNRS